MEKPIVLMDWTFEWSHYKGRWATLFPQDLYGVTIFDTHLYDFQDSVSAAQADWDKN